MLLVGDLPLQSLQGLLHKYHLDLTLQSPDKPITGSFWGDSEAGIVGTEVFARPDTPVHSLLHETCHTICMDEARRAGLDRDAGGDDLEEAAVCYLQILLADEIVGVGRERLMSDMDAWGYSFRLGSTSCWFARDAEDAAAWLLEQGLIDSAGSPTFTLRGGV
ncbi:MAG: hypothetical protein ACR2QS_07290 [Woeseiaceae bacterium]